MRPMPPARPGVAGASGPSRHRRGRLLRAVGALAATAILIGGGWVWLSGRGTGLPVLVPACRSTALGNTTSLSPEQAGNAAIIAAVAEKRGLPARAATIGIATAIQESKLRNIDYGDRDSVGLFQQRPSQGWGTQDQIMDPVYAANAFFDVLVKVEGYQSLPITQAAQKVQRSAFPSAYADHEPEARIFASALTGYSAAALTCSLRPENGLVLEQPDANGQTARTRAVITAAANETGVRGVAAPDSVQADPGASADGAVGAGTTSRFTLTGTEPERHAWALAQWAVARADGLSIDSVATAGQRWTRQQGAWAVAEGAPAVGVVEIQVTTGG